MPKRKVAQLISDKGHIPGCANLPIDPQGLFEQGTCLFRVGARGGIVVAVRGDLIGCSILMDSRAAAFETADLVFQLAEYAKEVRLHRKSPACQARALGR